MSTPDPQQKQLHIYGLMRLAIGCLFFSGILFLTIQIASRSLNQQVRKYDHANINHMKYGLFSVSVWKEKLANIVVKEIESFKIDSKNVNDLKSHMETQLHGLIDRVDQQIREANKGSTKGWIKQKFIDALVDIEDIKKGIPSYAEMVVQEITKDKTQSQLKEMVKKRIGDYLSKTFDEQEIKEINEIVARTGKANSDQAREFLDNEVPQENSDLWKMTLVLIVFSAALFLVLGFHWGRFPPTHFFLCLSTLLLLLFAGVTCPMIDMEAKVAKFGFTILGHPITFENQVVYFQSKSIIDVFWIMMEHKDMQMKFVGILMILFSIVFPVLKMSSSILYYYDIFGSQKKWWVKFFVLKSGKWSMADVQVVAILMAYIGFNGMVTSQFATLSASIPKVEMISTNGTTLQIGFYIFISYVTLAMFLPSMIEKQH